MAAQEITTPAAPTPLAIEFEAPDGVRETITRLGRTEDLRFSPSGRRLALACYERDQIALAEVRIAASPAGLAVAVPRLDMLSAEGLRDPHGVDFADEDTLVVGNRGGGIGVFRLQDEGGKPTFVRLPGTGSSPPLDSPGSVAVRPLGGGRGEVLACNNWKDTITRHTLDPSGAVTGGEVLAAKLLDLPDGLAVSGDGRWLAVSNHDGHNVFVYAYATLDEHSDPVAILRGARYPHGLRFDAGGDRLLVADAGSPVVHVFERGPHGWSGARYPSATMTVVDEHAFALGNRNPREGGPKGIDVHRDTNVVAVTCEQQRLAFFDADAASGERDGGGGADALLGYELLVLGDVAHLREDAAEARARLAELFETKAWRLTAPARRLYAVARRVRGLRAR
jgi:DNA-binding beta-propeller fold protein YncE